MVVVLGQGGCCEGGNLHLLNGNRFSISSSCSADEIIGHEPQYIHIIWYYGQRLEYCVKLCPCHCHHCSSSLCSMNVQGDYEPTDAGGFIKINALRSVLTYLKCVGG